MSDFVVDTFEHAGLTIEIRWDEDPGDHANPRNDDGHLGVMACAHPDYRLGDKDAPDPRKASFVQQLLVAGDPFETAIVKHLKREYDARVIIPLFLYDHSGITMFAGHGRLDNETDDLERQGRYAFDTAGWDVSSVGVIYDTAETRKECGLAEDVTDEEIERQLRDEVRWYDAYLTNRVYGYVVTNDEDEHLDSCWGFLELDVQKDDAYVRTAAREAADALTAEIADKSEAHVD